MITLIYFHQIWNLFYFSLIFKEMQTENAFTHAFSELSWNYLVLFWQTKVITSKTQCCKHVWEFGFTNSCIKICLHKLALIYLYRTCWILNVQYGHFNCILFFRDAADVVVDVVVDYWRMDILLCKVRHSFDVSCLQDVYFKFRSCHTLRGRP